MSNKGKLFADGKEIASITNIEIETLYNSQFNINRVYGKLGNNNEKSYLDAGYVTGAGKVTHTGMKVLRKLFSKIARNKRSWKKAMLSKHRAKPFSAVPRKSKGWRKHIRLIKSQRQVQ